MPLMNHYEKVNLLYSFGTRIEAMDRDRWKTQGETIAQQ